MAAGGLAAAATTTKKGALPAPTTGAFPGSPPPTTATMAATVPVTTTAATTTTTTTATTTMSGGNTTGVERSRMNWEPVRSRLLGVDLDDALAAARKLRKGIEIVHTVEFPLMLSALLPAFSTILATNPSQPGFFKPSGSGGSIGAITTTTTKTTTTKVTLVSAAAKTPSAAVAGGSPPTSSSSSAAAASIPKAATPLPAVPVASLVGAKVAAIPKRENLTPAKRGRPDEPEFSSSSSPLRMDAVELQQQQQQEQHNKHYQLRNTILEIISRMPSNEVLRPHAPHLVAVALDVLLHRRDYEENALLASRIIFDLYKAYRSLPQDYIQPALDFVVSAYKTLPGAVQRSFSFQALSAAGLATSSTKPSSPSRTFASPKRKDNNDQTRPDGSTESNTSSGTKTKGQSPRSISGLDLAAVALSPTPISPSTSSYFRQISLSPRSNASFRVLTEWPLIVMLMFQLYPKFLKGNISILIRVMTEALSLRAPTIESIEKIHQHHLLQQQKRHNAAASNTGGPSQDHPPLRQKLRESARRLYFSKSRELVAAQAKTLSFLTYLLRGYFHELKPYEDRLASNVVAIMSTCPRELLSTRKELLVATRHLLNSEFRNGFFRHIHSLLDETILIGWSSKHKHRHRYICHQYSEQNTLRPLGYTVLSDLIQQTRNIPILSLAQIARVVTIFSRVLHDVSLPMSTQYTAVRTLLSVVDAVFSNKDRNPQLGRDLLVRILRTLVEKLATLHASNGFEGNRGVGDTSGNKNKSDSPRKNGAQSLGKTKANERTIEDAANKTEAPFCFENKNEPLKDKKCMVRAIVVGSKTLIWYINNYRAQREKEKIESMQPPRAGIKNEEVFSGLSKITHAEHDLIDRYIVLGIPCIRILKESGRDDADSSSSSSSSSRTTPAASASTGTAGERPAAEQFRDTLTYFAAAFTTLDGHDLRRIMGRRLDVLVNAVKEDPAAIIVPRHLLSANSTTSFQFCSMMMNFLVDRMDCLVMAKTENICFLSVSNFNESNRLEAFQRRLAEKESIIDKDTNKTSNAYLQLFERILKSLSSYPENERALRPHLKKIVSSCLRSSLEKIDVKADNYCMLLRYVFRSISAGKFEESYRELLPLIPAVLNGLFRVLSSTNDTTLRHTLIELVLTIPARLSSLLPHMNLLLRVIILALKSNSDDLVNLGLRTLEFWVDNLNPEFLFPELSKQKIVFVSLMKALSIHLRPAPYPYGLLTLRLLGKLGGKNRRVLREPIDIVDPSTFPENSIENICMDFKWSAQASKDGKEITEKIAESSFKINLPIQRCLEFLKKTSNVKIFDSDVILSGESPFPEKKICESDGREAKSVDVTILLSKDIGDVDLLSYCNDVAKETTLSQVKAAIQVLRSALTKIIDTPNGSLANIDFKPTERKNNTQVQIGSSAFDMQKIAVGMEKYNREFHTIALGLMFGCSFAPIRDEQLRFVKGLITNFYVIVTSNQENTVRVDANGSPMYPSTSTQGTNDLLKEFGRDGLGSLKPFGYFELNGPLKHTTDPLVINKALAEFLAQSSPDLIAVGLDILKHMLELPKILKSSDEIANSGGELDRGSMIYFENLLSALCDRCVASDWSKRNGLYKGMIMMVDILGQSWAQRYEIEIMNIALFAVKSVPAEMSIAGIKSFEFFVQVCGNLYGRLDNSQKSNVPFIIDMLSLLKTRDDKSTATLARVSKPCSDVLQMILNELASTSHLVRAAARFVFEQYFLNAATTSDAKSMLEKQIVLIRRVLFSRSLRLLPLQEQVGAVEALTVLVDRVPTLIPLEDQHLLAFLSELLKMASVADGEMTDNNLIGSVVDKNGFVIPESRNSATVNDAQDIDPTLRPSSLFLRRNCILTTDSQKLLVGEELPCGIQLRVSSIQLLRSIIRGYPDSFFDADSSTPVGNIRPHVISLLFRSLVSHPIQAVSAAHDALRDVLTLSVVTTDGPEGSRSKSRLRKELLQTCIRPVLLNLRDYTRLSTCLLRGLSQLLSLLSSWFNKTLGEKLLDHLQKWTDPNLIKSQKKWKEGEEPDVAAAIVGLFTLLPHASNFVDPLVKTTIKLEACLPAYKSRHIFSPYRKPLALYLNKYSQHTKAFFLQRLKTPIYTELFQDIVQFKESTQLRQHLSGKKSSVSLLNISFERPLAIIRSEKTSVAGASPTKALMRNDTYLPLYGIHPFPTRSQNQKEISLLRDLGTKEKKLRILQQEFVKAKENLQVRGTAGSVKNATPEVKIAFEEAKKKHKIAKAAFDRGAREVTDIKKRYAAEVEKSKASQESTPKNPDNMRPMTIDCLELQFQGFKLIETLVKYDSSYLKQDNDVLRALRWLWRSKGRFLRMQHEESLSPRYQGETKYLAHFLVSYFESSPNDVDLLFELIRVFLQPVSCDFSFVRSFLKKSLSGGLKKEQKEQVMQRFFALMAGESTEEIKLLSLQLVVYPMLYYSFHKSSDSTSVVSNEDSQACDKTMQENQDIETSTSTSKKFEFLSSEVVQKFVTDVLFHNGKINPCGEQLKVGLLQVAALFLEYVPNEFKDKEKDLIKFCWSLKKSDDVTCKNWAYVVLCRYINAVDAPQEIILQVFDALLRDHQQEGKDLIRIGLNLLVPALPKRLAKSGFRTAVDNTFRLMFEEGNSVPQLAHVWYIVVHHPSIFQHRRSQLVRYMINSLNRLGLPPNSPVENRVLAISIVELVLRWERDKEEQSCKTQDPFSDAMDIDDPIKSSSEKVFHTGIEIVDDNMLFQIDKSMVETMVNFLVRLKILLADAKVDTQSANLEPKLNTLLRDITRRWNGAMIRPVYFEKVVSMCKDDDEKSVQINKTKGKKKNTKETDKSNLKGSKPTGSSKDDDAKKSVAGLCDILATCLQVFLILAEEDPSNAFLIDNPGQLKVILSCCFRHSKVPTENSVRDKLDSFLVAFLSLGPRADDRVVRPITVWLEKLIANTDAEYRKNHGQITVEIPRQARLRQPAQSEEARPEDCAGLFSLGIIQKVGKVSHSFPKLFTNSLLSLLSTILKKHTLKSAAKQKQNGVAYNSQTGTISIRQMNSTPIAGILQQFYPESSQLPVSGTNRTIQGKQHDLSKELKNFDYMLQSAAIILDVLGGIDLVYFFSNSRKTFISLLQSIFDLSNNVHLLLSAVRIVGKWLAEGTSGPLTTKERNSFLRQISSFDFNGLSDILSQPLADVVCYHMNALLNRSSFVSKNRRNNGEDMITSRSLIACLMTANDSTRENIISLFQGSRRQDVEYANRPVDILWRLFHSDFEGLGGRHWVVVFVEILLGNAIPIQEKKVLPEGNTQMVIQRLPTPRIGASTVNSNIDPEVHSTYEVFKDSLQNEHSSLSKDAKYLLRALCRLAHSDSFLCQSLMQTLLPASWNSISNDSAKIRLVSAIESFLSRPFHTQAFKKEMSDTPLPPNSIKSFLSSVVHLDPLPFIDVDLLIMLAQNYNSWYEVLTILENQYFVLSSSKLSQVGSINCDKVLLAMRHCYRQLGETKIWSTLALKSCSLPGSSYATSLEIYGKVDKALEAYSGLIDLVESEQSTSATYFEMDYWEERWVKLQQEEQQLEVISEYARQSKNEEVMLECAWRERDWDSVRSLCSSPPIVAAVESGNPAMKICETLSAVADGKLGDVENLHAQSSQLALYKWQNLPGFSGGSSAHAKLLHYFHRLVEIRESGQIMVETNNHSTGKTLPDLKNLLKAWRHRLPNDEEDLTVWDEIFTWRSHMFNAITSNFNWSEPSTLATLHDRPWTAIRMSMVARKHDMQQTAFLLLNRITDSRAMDVSDAYLKLREQILLYNNPENELERTGGLNLINTTNLAYFDSSQKSELFRLKAIFLASLRRTSKSNQAYCHSVQICPSHAKSWISWGGLCSSLGSMTEKQAEQARAERESRTDSTKKVAQYLAQAMGCFIEAIQIDPNEKSRIHLPRCLWMLTKDGSSPGVLCQTLENRGTKLPPWVWLPWIPQLLTGLCRQEGRAIKVILSRVIKAYPQAAYHSLRAFYLERRDVERAKGGNVASGQHMASVAYAEEMMSTLRRSHASLWSSLEAILEELIVKFRPSYEEELLATISALLERAESHAEKQSLPDKKRIEDEEAMVASWSKTLSRIAAKFFRETDSSSSSNRRDERVKKTADFKRKYKADFEQDFKVANSDTKQGSSATASKAQFRLAEYITKLQAWKEKLEIQVARTPNFLPLIESSHSLAMYHGTFTNLWPGSCDTRYSHGNNRSSADETMKSRTPPSASSSAAIARKAALNAALTAAKSAAREGVGGEYGGGSSSIEIPGQYCPNTSSFVDIKPCPELHAKLIKFEPYVEVLRRNDQLVRRCGMIGSDGRTYKFLLQFAIPYWTRTDERAAQTTYIIDKFLRKNIVSARNYVHVQPTAAIPVAQRLRMTPDPDCRLALDEVWRSHKEEVNDGKQVANFFSKELTKRLKGAVSHTESDENKRKAEKGVRSELYREIRASMVDDRVLLRYLLKVFDGPESFYLFRRAFAVQLAANSLLQYVFSVAERTPQRFVILQSNGNMMSPDFRISYSNQGFIENYNQVPFRMTPNIQKALGEHYIQGIFVRTMAMIAGAVKQHKEEFDPILRLLMRDDILAWYSKSLAKTDSKTQELEKQLIERVSKNVYTLQSRFSECSPNRSDTGQTCYAGSKDGTSPPLDKRVNELLEAATDPENLCMTRISYQGWL